MKKKYSLTEGPIMKSMLIFMIPLLVGNVFQQLYSLIDAIVVGQTIGENAFTAVGCTGSITFLIFGFTNGFTAGLSVITSQYFGAKDETQIKKSVATCLLLSLFASIILTAISVAFAKPLLLALKTSEALLDDALTYLQVIFLGMIAQIFYNMVCFILRAVGDSKTPLYALIIASIINIFLDFAFIKWFKMGVAGAALATIISQLISAAICFIYMFHKYPFLRPAKGDWKISFHSVREHLHNGIPMAFQFSIIAIGLLVQQWSVNELDASIGDQATLYATSYSVASKIHNIAGSIMGAMGTAMSTYCGQNYGARDSKRIKQGFKSMTILSVIVSIILGVLIILLSDFFVFLFTGGNNQDIKDNVRMYLVLQAVFYILLDFIFIYRSGLQGLGKSNITVIAGVLELVMRIITCIFFAKYFHWVGVSIANPAAWLGADLILIPALFYYLKRLNKDFETVEENAASLAQNN